ncbi:glycosyltransferase family 39 protein [candidate division WWE3 bacterium]|nr:glycosyltransferase family 39 protein [candidate division WWE3 bacterium]
MIGILKKEAEKLFVLGLAALAFALRFVNLGYSEFQGDEVRALYDPGHPLLEFLISQKKGPFQFLITYAVKSVTNSYDELWTRTPFAIFGLLSVLVLYLLVKELYGKRVALVSALLFSVNGFFVAFSRIAQYQSVNYFFFLLAFYFFIRLSKTADVKNLLLGCVALAFSLLAHYDGVFVGLPSLYFVALWYLKSQEKGKTLKLVLCASVFVVMVLIFYLPFILNPSFASSTKAYLLDRLQGVYTKETNVIVTYLLYNPFISLYFISLLAVVGVVVGRLKLLPLYLWFIPPFFLFSFVISVPGTHIYNYIIPAIIMCSYGICAFYSKLRADYLKQAYVLLMALIVSFLAYQSYAIFVDHSIEYPWYGKKILFWEAKPPPTEYHLSVFGFPYNRRLEDVNAYLRTKDNLGGVTSNERPKLFDFYVGVAPSLNPTHVAYVYIYGAQSLRVKKTNAVKDLNPDASFYRGGVPLSEVYFMRVIK